MKNNKSLKEIKFMMERMESPRMTDSEFQKKYKKLIKEDNNRGDFKKEFISSMETYGHYTEHEDEIKNEVSNYIDSLSDDDFNSLNQMVNLKKGIINQDDVDIISLIEFSQRLAKDLEDIMIKFG